jgi:hypothetical protein
MKRQLIILTGADSGKAVPLDTPLFIIGRSSSANFRIDDPRVSRHHLKLQVEADRVLVEDKSSSWANLNGKRLKGVATLSCGDILEVEDTQIRFEETAEGPIASPDDPGPSSTGTRGTQFMEPIDELLGGDEGDPEPDATRGIVGEKTRMLNPDDLPKWKAPPTSRSRSRKTVVIYSLAACVCVMAVTVACFFIMKQPSLATGDALDRYTDPVYALSVSYPSSWSRFAARPETPLMVGLGKLDEKVWTRMRVDVDRGIQYETTGLTEGFLHYQHSVKSTHVFLGSKPMTVNELSCVFYGFKLKNGQGKGLFLLNGGTRIVVECFSSASCYQEQAALFSKLLTGFTLLEVQQTLDFPLPDDGMQKMALGDPEGVEKMIDEHKRTGDALVANRNVKQDNLYRAIQEYKQALQLSIARPERAKGYRDAAIGLRSALNLYNQGIQQQRYEINRAIKEGDRETAYWAASKLLQMLPDKKDANYQETFQLLRQLSPKK